MRLTPITYAELCDAWADMHSDRLDDVHDAYHGTDEGARVDARTPYGAPSDVASFFRNGVGQ